MDERYDDMIIALLDASGRPKVRQKIYGPFNKIIVEKPNILMAIAGPAVNLLKKTSHLIIGNRSEVFYNGSVPPPSK